MESKATDREGLVYRVGKSRLMVVIQINNTIINSVSYTHAVSRLLPTPVYKHSEKDNET